MSNVRAGLLDTTVLIVRPPSTCLTPSISGAGGRGADNSDQSRCERKPRVRHSNHTRSPLIRWVGERSSHLAATLEAFSAGLRRGELRALRVGAVDLGASSIFVERSWDDKEADITPKSQAG